MLRLPFLNLKKLKDLENSFLGITFDSLRVNVVYFEVSSDELNPTIQVKSTISRFIGEKIENLFKEYQDDSALIETLRLILTELSGEFPDVSNQVIFGLSADKCIDLMSIVSLENSMRLRFTKEQAKELDEQAYKNASFRAQDVLATQVGDMESDLDLVASVDVFKKIDGTVTRDPIGLEGKELEQAWFGSFVRRTDLERFKNIAKKLNLKILTVSSLNYAFYTCLTQYDQKYSNCVVVDLNNDLTQVSVAFGGSIVGSRFMNMGLVSVLDEIGSRLGLYPDEAWEVLEKYRQGTLDSLLAQKVQKIIHRFFVIWSKALSEVFSDFSGIKTFSSNVVLVGPGFDLPDLHMLTSNEPWFKSVPFKAPPNFEKGLASDKITKVSDLTGKSSLFVVEFANIIVKRLRKNEKYFVMVYTVNKTKDVYTILADLAVRAEKDLEIFIPSGSLLLQDKLNLEFLAKSLEKLGKTAKFDTDDANCRELLDRLNLISADFAGTQDVNASSEKFHRTFLIKLKFFVLSALSRLENLAKLKKPDVLPKINFALLGAFIVVLAGLIYGGYRYASSQKAYIKIYTKSEPLARSITVRVDSNSSTNTDEKILEGTDISTSVFETKEIETTGEKEEGDYAEGEIVIYNYTKEEIKLNKGVKVFCKDDDDLGFKLTDGVTIDPATYEVQEEAPPLSMTVTPNEVKVSVIALEYGSDYNIDNGKTLEFEDYEKEDLLAKSSEDFKGGNTEIVKIVSEEDIAKLKEVIETALMGQSTKAINDVVPSNYKLIKGSITTLLEDPELSAEVGDEETKVNIKQALTVSGLAYSEKKLDQLIMKVVGDYVPEEYALAGTKHALNVEVLGATEDTVLSNSAADLQVTVKTYVIPEIDIDSLKESLKGMSVKEVQRELGGMSNITTYEFSLSPIVPLKKNVPNDVEKIFIEIQEGSDD